MIEPDLVGRANDVIESAQLLDEAAANMLAFRLLLEELRKRGDLPIEGEQGEIIRSLRASLLRSTISSVTAILDTGDSRGNRASVGYIATELKDDALINLLASHTYHKPHAPDRTKLAELAKRYSGIDAELSSKVRLLRNNTIAHLLRPTKRAPEVQYDDIFALCDEAEVLVSLVLDGIGFGGPRFTDIRPTLADRARMFWDTYSAGIGNASSDGKN